MDKNDFGGPRGSSGKLTTLQVQGWGTMTAFPRLLAGRSARGAAEPWAALGVPSFLEGAEAATLESEGLGSRQTPVWRAPAGGQEPGAPGALPLLPTFPALVPEEGAFPGGSRAILKAARLGKAVVSRSARRHRGGSVQRWEPEEGHGAAAGLLSTGARAAGGTVSASKGQAPLTATWGPWGCG